MKTVSYFPEYNFYSYGQNIFRIFDVLTNFSFATSKTKPDY